ncbi:MAG: hypothetical protein C5B56_07550 [Proteobacteria bacterium]|nr:MAG: hypothetical protein C5B56_07550 [Pseudomonadota bacterium]
MFVLAAAALLDSARVPTPELAAAPRGDRLDVAERAAACGSVSVIAACADDAFAQIDRAKANRASLIQVFERPNETILVRVKLGD